MKIQEWRLQDLGADDEVLREGVVSREGLEIGRTAMGMGCPGDPQMSARHARLFLEDGQAYVEELGSTTGVWLRVPSGVGCALGGDDQVWLGAQILLIRKREEGWQIRHHGPDGRLRDKFPVPEGGVFLGRTSDLVLDKEDSRLSRRHAQIVREGDGLRLYDRGAHNGTYLKLVKPMALRNGDEFRIATHRFRIEAIPEEMAPSAQDSPEATVLQTARPAPLRSPVAQPAAQQRPEAQVVEPKGVAAAQNGQGEQRQGGLAARLKRLGRSSSQAEAAEVPPSELGAREEERPAEQLRVPEPALDASEEATVVVLEDASEEATIMVTQDETVEEFAPVKGTRESAPPVEMLGETLPPSTRRSDLPPASMSSTDEAQSAVRPIVNAEFEIHLEAEDETISIPAAAGQTVLEAVQAAGLSRGEPLDWECGDGGCGVCVMGLVGSADGLESPDPEGDEMKTIQITEQVAPDPALYRLACLARVRGNIRLRRL